MNKHWSPIFACMILLLSVAAAMAQPPAPPDRRDGPPPPPPPFELGRVLPPSVRDGIELTKDQADEIAKLEAEVKQRLEKILTPAQKDKIKDLRTRGPGGPGTPLDGSRPLIENAAIIIKAKHYRTMGPCIRMGNALGMPIIDAFEVVEVVKGSLPVNVKHIMVRAMTGDLENLKGGKVYLLRLTPSADTKSQLRDRKDDNPWLWVNCNELRHEKNPK